AKVDEAGTGDLDRGYRRQGLELRLDQLGKRPRVGLRRLGEHHRGVGREIAMLGIARRLDRHVLAVEIGRKRALGNELVEHSVEERGILGVKAQFRSKGSAESGASSAAFAARHAISGFAKALPRLSGNRVVITRAGSIP